MLLSRRQSFDRSPAAVAPAVRASAHGVIAVTTDDLDDLDDLYGGAGGGGGGAGLLVASREHTFELDEIVVSQRQVIRLME